MSWKTSQLYRLPITVDNSAGGAGAFNATVALQGDLSHFWTTVQSTGNDIRVTRADGFTAVTKFDLDAFSTSGATGTVEIDDSAAGAGMLLYWLYWGDSSLSSGVSAFVPAGALTGYVDPGVPVSGYLVKAPAQERLDSTDALNKIAKTSDSTIFVWVDFGHLLQRRETQSGGTVEYELLSRVTVTAGAGLTSTASGIRFEVSSPGAGVVRTQLSGGTTANDYLVTVTAYTSLGRTLTAKFVVLCRDIAT